MDDRSLFRFKPGYKNIAYKPALDWSAWNVQNDPMTEALSAPGTGGDTTGGFAKATEMCNNNGHCRKFDAGTMCPSFRVTRDEKHLTRGRANTLRLALSGQLEGALTSDAVAAAMDLCVSCKGCKRDCPTGVDMARMKIEVRSARRMAKGLSWRDRLIGNLPEIAPWARRVPWLFNMAWFFQSYVGFAKQRRLPQWRRDTFLATTDVDQSDATVVIFADTFSNNFEPHVLHAARRVLRGGRPSRRRRPGPTSARRRCAAGAPISRPARSRRPRPRRGGCCRRCCPSSPRVCRSSAWNRRACSRCATRSWPWALARTRRRSATTPSCSRNFWRARRRRVGCSSR